MWHKEPIYVVLTVVSATHRDYRLKATLFQMYLVKLGRDVHGNTSNLFFPVLCVRDVEIMCATKWCN